MPAPHTTTQPRLIEGAATQTEQQDFGLGRSVGRGNALATTRGGGRRSRTRTRRSDAIGSATPTGSTPVGGLRHPPRQDVEPRHPREMTDAAERGELQPAAPQEAGCLAGLLHWGRGIFSRPRPQLSSYVSINSEVEGCAIAEARAEHAEQDRAHEAHEKWLRESGIAFRTGLSHA